MITEQSLEDFMKAGSLVWKVGSKSGIKEKLVWASDGEIRWSSPEGPQSSSKLDTSSILSVWTQEKYGNHFLIIEARYKTYKLQFKSPQIREKWHLGIQSLISGTQNTSNYLSTRNTVLGESNKERSENNDRKVLEEISDMLKQFSHKKCGNESCLKDLPKALESTIKEINAKNYEQVEWLNSEENDPKRLSSKISIMRKRLKMMEIEKEATSQIENLTFLLEKEQKQNFVLAGKIEEAAADRSKIQIQWNELRSELEKVQDLKVIVQSNSEVSLLSSATVMNRVLQKGFICYICTSATAEKIESLILTPRRGYEEGVYKKRQVKLSSDLISLIWKPVGLFCKKSFSLPLNDICTVVEGTEDSSKYEPYENCKYLTIVTKNLTAILCIENYYSLYLDGIRQLYLQTIGLQSRGLELSSVQIARLASEQLQNQLLTFSRMFKRYKSNLVESICSVQLKDEESEEVLSSELQNFKSLNENLPLGIMSADSENYLRNERKVLVERIQTLTALKGGCKI
jgi:hypothetical protein